MNHTVTAKFDRNQGLYFYYLNGKEFLRDIDPYMFATIHTRPNSDGGESVWAHLTRTKRKAGSKATEAAGGVFQGIVEVQW